MNSIDKEIVMNLSENRYSTAGQLAEKILVNEKTIRNYIKTLSDTIKDYGAEIERKHGYGYKLIIKDSQLFSTFFTSADNVSAEEYIPQNAEERCSFMIRELITGDDDCTISGFAEKFYVSEYTVQSDLNKVRKILENYNLKLTVRNLDDLSIEGNEFDKRIILVNYESLYSWSSDDEMKTVISEALLSVLDKYQVSISEVSVQNLILHLYMAVVRIREGNGIESEIDMSLLNNEEDNLCNIIADETCDILEQEFEVEFSREEREVLALHLFGHRVTEKYGAGNTNVVISQSVYDDVVNILQFIYVTLRIDERKNLNLIMNLAVHLVSMDVRMRYNIHLKNPLLMDIKKKYALGYTMASQAAIYLENKYGRKIDDDETAYLALVFEVSLKSSKEIRKKNILIVCATGRTSAELLSYQYRELFGSYLNKILTCNISEIGKQDFSDIDYVLTTTTVKVSVPVPIMAVNMFLTDEDEAILKEVFRKNENKELYNFYSPDMFFTDIDASDKNDAIYKLCEAIEKVRKLPDGFAEGVIRRESFGATDFGETVALAHPYEVYTEKTFAAVGILKKPVFWGNHDVQIILLISVSQQNQSELIDFYQKTSVFMLDRSRPKKLLQDPTFENLIKLLTDK